MVVLLAISTALAILVPEPPRDRNGSEGTGRERPANTDREPGGKPPSTPDRPTVRNPAAVVEKSVRVGGAVETIQARAGDRLILEVRSTEPVLVEIDGAGLIDPADRYAPARFDLLLRERPRRLVVREADPAGRTVASIEVR